MHIRKALAEDAQELTRIAFAAKSYWNYPEAYYKVWEAELTISPDYIRNNDVYLVSEDDGGIIGFYSVVEWKGDTYLDHNFIDPRFLKQGIGSNLMKHLIEMQREKGIRIINILVDPNAAGFMIESVLSL
jgi:maltose O-acetyltransferase